VVIPFDSGGQVAIGVALANASQVADAQIAMTMRDEQGRTIPMTITDPQGGYSKTAVTSMTLAKHSHRAFKAQPLNATVSKGRQRIRFAECADIRFGNSLRQQ
jgi:hypothetical protein